MSEAPRDTKQGFQPAEWRWGRLAYFVVVGLSQAACIYTLGEGDWKLVGGDWRPIQQAVPSALALTVACVGAVILISLVLQGMSTRRWPDMSGLLPRRLSDGLVRGLALGLLFLFALHWSLRSALPESPDSASGTGWAKVFSDLTPNAGDAMALVGALLFLVAAIWWLGFVERDRARAAAKDRLSMGPSGGGAST
jgi:hypothetical protein